MPLKIVKLGVVVNDIDAKVFDPLTIFSFLLDPGDAVNTYTSYTPSSGTSIVYSAKSLASQEFK